MSSSAPLFSLVYKSEATTQMNTARLESITEKAIARNADLGVTGVLLSDGAHFIQYLEGPKKSVEALYAIIKDNPAHTCVKKLISAPISSRAFPKWFMGLIQPSTSELLNLMHWEWWDTINDNPLPEDSTEGVRRLKIFCEKAGARPMGCDEY